MSFQRLSSHPISWLSNEENKPNTTKANNTGKMAKTHRANLSLKENFLNEQSNIRTAYV